MCQQLPVHGGAAVRAGVVAVADVLLGHHEVAAGALVLQLHHLLLLAVLHHPGHRRGLVGKGLANGCHELWVLCYG